MPWGLSAPAVGIPEVVTAAAVAVNAQAMAESSPDCAAHLVECLLELMQHEVPAVRNEAVTVLDAFFDKVLVTRAPLKFVKCSVHVFCSLPR